MASLNISKAIPQDEYYTSLTDIQKELSQYKKFFQKAFVFCNADDYRISNFVRYFNDNFEALQLKALLAISLTKQAYYREGSLVVHGIAEDGSYRANTEYLERADVVVTNPPFSLFRDYVNFLYDHNKKFIIMGSQGALSYNEIFERIRDGTLKTGYNYGSMEFEIPEEYERGTTYHRDGKKYSKLGNICWYTNLSIKKEEPMLTNDTIDVSTLPYYDNYPAREAGKTVNIPTNFYGELGVPVTILNKMADNQFNLIGKSDQLGGPADGKERPGRFYLNGKRLFERIVVSKPRVPLTSEDSILLTLTEEDIIRAITEANHNYIDNVNVRDPIAAFDSQVCGNIGEIAFKSWLTANGVEYETTNTLTYGRDTDLLVNGKTVEVKTSKLPGISFSEAVSTLDIKVIKTLEDLVNDIDRDYYIQIYFSWDTKTRKKELEELYDKTLTDPKEIMRHYSYHKTEAYFVAWKKAQALIQELQSLPEDQRTVSINAKKSLWRCPIKYANTPMSFLEVCHET